ncbi:MAG: ATP-binding protein [Catalinimonas sp.]
MFLTPRAVAVVLAGCIALITTAFLSLVSGTPAQALLVTAALSFASAFILIYLTLEFMIFREITRIYEVLRQMKRKDAIFKIKRKKLRNVSNPLKRLNDEIFLLASRKQAEIDELKRMESFRRDFLADVSHELKTPIFAAQGFLHTLLDGAVEDPNVRGKFLENAARSLDGLDALVQDLLTISKMESGTIKMHHAPFDLVELVREVVDQLAHKAHCREIALKIAEPPAAPLRVRGDRDRMRQVVTNLVENGIKYGQAGGHVELEVGRAGEGVKLTVRDDGPGIPKAHLPRIFERFYRVDKSRSKDTGGSGLGLAIVKHIVEAHGASIDVRSKLGKGTIFSFKLPAAAPQEAAPLKTAAPTHHSAGPSGSVRSAI